MPEDYVKELEDFINGKKEEKPEEKPGEQKPEEKPTEQKPVEKPEEKGNETWQEKMMEAQNLTLEVLGKIVDKVTPAENSQEPQKIPAPPEKKQEDNKPSEQSSKEGRSWLSRIW